MEAAVSRVYWNSIISAKWQRKRLSPSLLLPLRLLAVQHFYEWCMRCLKPVRILYGDSLLLYFFAGNEILRECAADKSQTREEAAAAKKSRRTHKINKHVFVCGVSTLTGLVSSHSGIQNSVKLKNSMKKTQQWREEGKKNSLTHSTHSLKPNNTKNNNLWWFKVDNFTFFLY